MRKLLSALAALVIGLAPFATGPVEAQVIVPKAQGDAAIDHMRQATGSAERMTNLLIKVSTNPAYAGARDADQLRVAIAGMRGEVAAARNEIRAMTAELRALPTISGPSAPAELQLVDRVVSDIADFGVETDDFLHTLEQLGDALDAGQDARAQQLAASLMKGSISIVQAQSLMLRARLPMMPSDSSSFAQVNTLACFYDGFAALQSGAFEVVARPEAGAAMQRAQACMTEGVASGRAAIERELLTDHSEPALNNIRDGLAPVHKLMFNELEVGAGLLDDARTALLRGDSMEAISAHADLTTAFEQRYQALVAREIEVVRRQGQ